LSPGDPAALEPPVAGRSPARRIAAASLQRAFIGHRVTGAQLRDPIVWLPYALFMLSMAQMRREEREMIRTINHVKFHHEGDMEAIKRFFEDFGLFVSHEDEARVYFRGYESRPFIYVAERGPRRFGSIGYEVESREALEALTPTAMKSSWSTGFGSSTRSRCRARRCRSTPATSSSAAAASRFSSAVPRRC
jgi:hypothetical protein